MKIFVSITMSFLFLFQGMVANMEVCEQIEKLSELINHYQEHKSFDGDTFFDFVYEDYIADKHHEDDHHKNTEDNNVPMHSGHQCCQHVVFFLSFEQTFINAVPSEEHSQFNSYTSNINSRYLDSLFQPPKV